MAVRLGFCYCGHRVSAACKPRGNESFLWEMVRLPSRAQQTGSQVWQPPTPLSVGHGTGLSGNRCQRSEEKLRCIWGRWWERKHWQRQSSDSALHVERRLGKTPVPAVGIHTCHLLPCPVVWGDPSSPEQALTPLVSAPKRHIQHLLFPAICFPLSRKHNQPFTGVRQILSALAPTPESEILPERGDGSRFPQEISR